jgi:hypothetical protein
MTALGYTIVGLTLLASLAGWVAMSWPELMHDDGKEGEP